jgi:hypothetical protein
VGAGALAGPLPAAAAHWLRRALEGTADGVCDAGVGARDVGAAARGAAGRAADEGAVFGAAPDGLRGTVSGSGGSGAPASPQPPRLPAAGAGCQQQGQQQGLRRTPSRRVGSASPAPLPSPLLGPDGVPVGSLFAIADKLTQAAAAALATTANAFDGAAEEEAQVR